LIADLLTHTTARQHERTLSALYLLSPAFFLLPALSPQSSSLSPLFRSPVQGSVGIAGKVKSLGGEGKPDAFVIEPPSDFQIDTLVEGHELPIVGRGIVGDGDVRDTFQIGAF